jgi:hypothetical protein
MQGYVCEILRKGFPVTFLYIVEQADKVPVRLFFFYQYMNNLSIKINVKICNDEVLLCVFRSASCIFNDDHFIVRPMHLIKQIVVCVKTCNYLKYFKIQ